MIRQLVLLFLFPILVFGNESISGDSEAKAKYIFYENGKVGLLNGYGKKIVPAKYDSFSWPKYGIIPAVEKDWFVFIKEDGTVIDKKFWEIGEFEPTDKEGVISEKLALAALYETKKYGFINSSGDFVINPVYDRARYFSNGFAEVKIGDKWGYLDKKGQIVIPAIYDDVWPFSSDGIAWVAQKGKQWKLGLINSKGVFILNCEYDKVNAINNILFGYKKSENKSRIFDRDGKILFENEGSGLLIDLGENMTGYRISTSHEWTIFNEQNEIVFKGKTQVTGPYENGALKVETIDDSPRYLNKKGVDVLFSEYLKKRNYFNGKNYVVWHKLGKVGIIEKSGDFILQPEYEYQELQEVSNDVFLITKDAQVLFSPPSNYYSINGADKLKFSGSDGYIFFEKAGKMGIVNEKAEIIVPAIYDEIKGRNIYAGDEDKNVFRVRQKGLWGVINEKGKVALTIDFESISPFYFGEAFAQKNGKKYVIKKSGEIKFVTDDEIGSIFFIDNGIMGWDHDSWPNRDRVFKKKP